VEVDSLCRADHIGLPDGQASRLLGTHSDITARKEAEASSPAAGRS
jgi:hypothetical protein